MEYIQDCREIGDIKKNSLLQDEKAWNQSKQVKNFAKICTKCARFCNEYLPYKYKICKGFNLIIVQKFARIQKGKSPKPSPEANSILA